MKNFKQLKVWQKGFEIAIKMYALIEGFPTEEKYGLASQLTRAAVSIPSNIAEGSSRSRDKDYVRFLEIALGSCFEAETQLLIAECVHYGKQEQIIEMLGLVDERQKMIIRFIKRVKSS